MKQLTQKTTRINEATQAHDFAATDKRGRAVGAEVYTYEVDFVPVEAGQSWGYTYAPGHYFCMSANATRNGKRFGASQPTHNFTTAAERDAAVAKYLVGARKRAGSK